MFLDSIHCKDNLAYYNKKRDQVVLEQQFALIVVRNYNKYEPVFSVIKNMPDCPYSELNQETYRKTNFSKKVFLEKEDVNSIPEFTLSQVLESEDSERKEKKKEKKDEKATKEKKIGEEITKQQYKYKYYVCKFEKVFNPNFKICVYILNDLSVINFRNAFLKRELIQQKEVRYVIYVLDENIKESLDYKEIFEWFQTQKQQLNLEELSHSLIQQIESKKPYIDKVSDFYKYRHDFLQSFICERYGLTNYINNTVNLEKFGFKKTPDFFEYKEEESTVLMGDIQVSRNYVGGLLNKKQKYQPIEDYFKGKGFNVITLYLIIDPRLRNLNTVFKDVNLCIFKENTKDLDHWVNIQASLERLLQVSSVDFHKASKELFIQKSEYVENMDPSAEESVLKATQFFTNQAMVKRMKESMDRKSFEEEELVSMLRENLNTLTEGKTMSKLAETYKDVKFEERTIELAFDKVEEINKMYMTKKRPSFFMPIPLEYVKELPFVEGEGVQKENIMIENFVKKNLLRMLQTLLYQNFAIIS